MPPSVRHKSVYTGYLRREVPLHTDAPHEMEEIDGPFILVTPGGGGDGVDLVDWVLSAYETDPHIPYGAVIVFGPFMSATAREAFKERAAKFHNIRTLTFTNNLGALMQRAAGVVAMGGYNTFCEILSFDKKAIIVPRTRPRLEQFIRTRAARNLGLLEMLDAERGRNPNDMATALRQLTQQGLPSDVVVPGLLDGIGNVLRLVSKQLAHPHRGPASLDAVEPIGRAGRARRPGRPVGTVQDLSAPGCFMSASGARVAVVLKGWPRLSETFIAQEIAGLEARGVALEIWSLRRPTDKARHPVHDRVEGRVAYLPEYLKDDPRRVLAGWLKARRLPGYTGRRAPSSSPTCAAIPRPTACAAGARRWCWRPSCRRRSSGSTPISCIRRASVTRYAATMRGLPWSVSAHAKDIWTSRAWESRRQARRLRLAGDLHGHGPAAPQGAGAKTGTSAARLSRPRSRALAGAAAPLDRRARAATAATRADPVVILSIGRKVEKKGYADLLQALARLPSDLNWRFEHVGAGELGRRAQEQARGSGHRRSLHLARRTAAEGGVRRPRPRRPLRAGGEEGRRRRPGRPAQRADGGRPPGPAHRLDPGRCHRRIHRSRHQRPARVAPGAPDELAAALTRLVRDPELRLELARHAARPCARAFSYEAGVDWIASALGQPRVSEARSEVRAAE